MPTAYSPRPVVGSRTTGGRTYTPFDPHLDSGVNRPIPDTQSGGSRASRAAAYTPPATNTKFQNAAFAATPGGSLQDQASAIVAPWWKRALEETRGSLADSGILQSTGGAQKLADVNTQYAAKAQEYYDTASMARANLGADIWERITARELQKKQLDSTYKTQMPVDPDFFKYFQGYDYIPQGYGQTGDAVTKWDRTDGGMESTDAGCAAVEGQRQFDKNYSLQKQNLAASIAAQQASEAATAKADDPWPQMAQMSLENWSTGKAAIAPETLLKSFEAAYGIDVRSLAAKGDQRAAALLKSIFGYVATAPSAAGGYQGVGTGYATGASDGVRGPATYPNSIAFSNKLENSVGTDYWKNLDAKGLAPITDTNQGKSNFLTDFLPFLKDWTFQK